MEVISEITRQRLSNSEHLNNLLKNPYAITRELNNRSLFHFLTCFWHVVSPHDFQSNWHIEYLCKELERLAQRVADKKPKEYDLIINIPPGSTKSIICSHIFPAWCWTKDNWWWMRFITASYSLTLALESGDYCRDIIRSPLFQQIYPDISITEDKDTKSNFKIVKKIPSPVEGGRQRKLYGGGRYSTSVGGTLMGFHADMLIIDDPINPTEAASDIQLGIANHWIEQTLPTRKTNKENTPTILIMQRLHQDDPSGHWLAKNKENVKHICLPGEIRNYKDKVNPPELVKFYKDDLLDVNRLSWKSLIDLESDLGQYGYAGQIGQDPTPPGGGMFKVDHFNIVDSLPAGFKVMNTVRYWDKAGTAGGKGPFTAGVKMSRLTGGHWLVEDVKRGRWGTNERENVIHETTVADGYKVDVWVEQEPGSGGKESAEGTIRNLAGFIAKAHKPSGSEGDKPRRADAYSVQVNNGNVFMLRALWNREYLEELKFFPFSTYKDMTDASSGAFNKLVGKKMVRRIT